MFTSSSEIESIRYFVGGNDKNLSDSWVEVRNRDLFKHTMPVRGGIYDPHMGTTENSWKCESCSNGKMLCPGHYGHVRLNYPLQSPMFATDIVQWLKIICFNCGNLIINKLKNISHVQKHKKRAEYVKLTRNVNKNIACYKCKKIHPYVIRDKNRQVTIWAELYGSDGIITEKYQLFNHMIAKIFDKISNETVVAMGKDPLSHPRKFILNIMKVPPNTIRPDIKKIGGGRSNNNDLTTLTKTIVDINNRLPVIIPDQVDDSLEVNYTNLDLTYYEMIKGTPSSSTKNKVTTNTNRPPKSLAGRMPQKTGRLRKNITGKRVWHIGRAFITCDPTLKVSEIGIPMRMAKTLQVKEVVNTLNRTRMLGYFNNARDIYPGCTSVIKKRTGNVHDINSINKDFVLENGDTIFRDMIDGDVALFNRQPSLWGPNMSAHNVVVMKVGDTIRLNISVCVLYNADFDGDAMMIVVGTSAMARNEISMMSNVGVGFISRQTASPMLGLFQDNLAGSVEMTLPDVRIGRRDAMTMFDRDSMSFEKKVYTGRELFSMTIPPVNFSTKAKFYNEAYAPFLNYDKKDITVKIKRGNLEQGIMDYNSCGQMKKNSIFHVIHNELGASAATETLFMMQRVVTEFMLSQGFTVNMDDISIPEEITKILHNKISAMFVEAKLLTKRLERGEIIPPLGMSVAQFYEQQMVEILRLSDDFLEIILKIIKLKKNGLYKMIFMCKKGSMSNAMSMVGVGGPILINGKRADDNFGYRRTLPYYVRYDPDPVANGFTPTSFVAGISPGPYIFSAQKARFGVINKALSTSISGHQNRENVKNLDSLMTNNLRQSSKDTTVVQYIYGGSGFDIRSFEGISIPTIILSNSEMKEYKSDISEFLEMYRGADLISVLDEEYKTLLEDRKWYREYGFSIESMYPFKKVDGRHQLPVNVKRIMEDIIHDYPDSKKKLDPFKAFNSVKTFCQDLPYVYMNGRQKSKKSKIPIRYEYAVRLILVYIRSYLNTHSLLKRKVSNQMLGLMLDKIYSVIQRSLVDYGMAIGILAAQSLSQPLTQYIIDSHHRSNVSVGDKQTDTMTRYKEVMLVKSTEKMKNPKMHLYVKPEYEDSMAKVQEIANMIEIMPFKSFVLEYSIMFEEYKDIIHPKYIKYLDMIYQYEKHNPNIIVPNDLIKRVIHFKLNKLKMVFKDMDLDEIVYGIGRKFPYLHIVHSSENSEEIIIRCYIRSPMFKKTQKINLKSLKALASSILDTSIRGAPGVYSAMVMKANKSYIDLEGKINQREFYMIKTSGSNLQAVLGQGMLDDDRCYCDSITEMEDMYGIEAARQLIIGELEKIVSDVHLVHDTVYADEMCVTGKVTAISKSGLDVREYDNPNARASYSFANQVFTKAAVNSQKNKIYGASAPLTVAAPVKMGTLYNEVMMDESFIKQESKGNISDIIDSF